jgi:hypothetical protein
VECYDREVRAPVATAFLATSLAALLAWACSSFTDSDDPGSVDSGASDGPSGGDADVPIDAAGDAGGGNDGGDATTAIGTLALPCPAPLPPTCALDQCTKRVLYSPAMPGSEFPFGIATDSAWVYWLSMKKELNDDLPYDGEGVARVMRVDRNGVVAGSEASVIATDQRRAVAIAMAGDHVYWAAMGGVQAKLRRVRRDCPSNCQPEELTSLSLGSDPIVRLVSIDNETLVAANGPGAVFVVKLTATSAVVSGNAVASGYAALAATAKECFVAGAFSTAVQRIPSQTSTALKFGATPDAGDSGLATGMSPIASDCTSVYGWRGLGSIWRIAGDGGIATEFSVGLGTGDVFDLAADQSYLYAAAPNVGGVFAISLTAAQPEQIAGGNVHRLAVDSAGIYYGEHDANGGGALHMIVK